MNLEEQICAFLMDKKSVVLIGETNSGKTWFAKRELVKFLRLSGLSVAYFDDCKELPIVNIGAEVAIIDEVETFLDQEFLEQLHSDKKPFYIQRYAERVKGWFEVLKTITNPCVYIVTRNGQEEIDNFVKNVKNVDWDAREIEVVLYKNK